MFGQEAIHKFVLELKEEGVFAKEVRSAGVAFHSYYMASIAPALLEALKKVKLVKTGPISDAPAGSECDNVFFPLFTLDFFLMFARFYLCTLTHVFMGSVHFMCR